VKRVTRPTLGCKSFDAAQYTLTGVELMHMLRNYQLEGEVEQGQTPAEQFYTLAASSPARHRFAHMKRVLDLWKRHRRPAYLVLSSEKSSYRVVHSWTITRLTRLAIARPRLMQWFASGEDFGMPSAWDASKDVGVVWYNWQIGGIVFSAIQRMEERRMTTIGVQRMTEEFRPQLFPGLAINLVGLLGGRTPSFPHCMTVTSSPDYCLRADSLSLWQGECQASRGTIVHHFDTHPIPAEALTSPSCVRMIAPRRFHTFSQLERGVQACLKRVVWSAPVLRRGVRW
jgi:hypothetical protein